MIQESFSLHQLRHENIAARLLFALNFCILSRDVYTKTLKRKFTFFLKDKRRQKKIVFCGSKIQLFHYRSRKYNYSIPEVESEVMWFVR